MSKPKRDFIRSIFNLLIHTTEDVERIEHGLIEASHEEYDEMITTPEHYNTIDDLNRYRLYLLTKHNVFLGYIPTEYEVIKLFSLSIDEATTLLKTLRNHYKTELKDFYLHTIKTVMSLAKPQTDGWHVNIRSIDLYNYINEILSFLENGELTTLEKVPGKGMLYYINNHSKDKLDKLDINNL